MNIYTYDFELQTMTTVLLNCFSDIVVKRFNVHKQARDQIKTRVVYAPKQRVLLDLLDKDQNIQLPVVSVHIGGIARDESRVFNKIIGTYHPIVNTSSSYNERGPQPIDVTYNVSIMTRYQQDMDQILSHLLPYVNPYFVVSWRTPNRPDFEIRSNVFWNGNVNIQYPVEAAATQIARVVADLTFTFKGWLFQTPQEIENIYTFHTNVSKVTNVTNLNNNIIPEEYSIEGTRSFVYESIPRPRVIEPPYTNIREIQQFEIWGTGFHKTTNVYLSGYPLLTKSRLHNPFFSVPSLSAENPSFSAVKLEPSEWSFSGPDSIMFTMPSANELGFVDVILENLAGYGKLTQNVKVNTFNPYFSSSPEYSTYVPYQVPYLSGIKVLPPVESKYAWPFEFSGYWTDVPVLSVGVVLYTGPYTYKSGIAANLSAVLFPGDFEGFTDSYGAIHQYRYAHPNQIDLKVPYYYNNVLTDKTILYYNGILINGTTILYNTRVTNPDIPLGMTLAANMSGVYAFEQGEDPSIWYTNLSAVISWQPSPIGKYWYSSTDTDWYALSSWYVDSDKLSAAAVLPLSTTRVVVLSGGLTPYVDLDDSRWVEPQSIYAPNVGITFYSAQSATVTTNITGAPVTYLNNSNFGP